MTRRCRAAAGPGPEAIRRAMRGPQAAPPSCCPPRPSLAAAGCFFPLLEDAGRGRGGAVLQAADGTLVVTDALGQDADRAAATIERLFGAPPERLDPAADAARLLALPGLVPAPATPRPPPATGVERLADEVPLPALLRRDGIMLLAPGQKRRLALIRLRCRAVRSCRISGRRGPTPTSLAMRGRGCARGSSPRSRRPGAAGRAARRRAARALAARLPARLLPEVPAGGRRRTRRCARPVRRADRRGSARAGAGRPPRGAAPRRLGPRGAGLDAAALSLLGAGGAARRPHAAALVHRPLSPGRRPQRSVGRSGTAGADRRRWRTGARMGARARHLPLLLAPLDRDAAGRDAHGRLPACRRLHPAQCAARRAAATPEGRTGCAAPALLAGLLPPEAAP